MKRLYWTGSSLSDIKGFPQQVKKTFGYALYVAQEGGKHPDAKPFRGFSGAGILEVVADYHSDTYRAVYTVRFKHAVYVLHAFQKKSKKGIKTPKQEMELIRKRLRMAEEHYSNLTAK